MNVKIGTIIKSLRKEQKVTQEELAAAVGVTPQAISRWEGEGGYPDIELLPEIADFFAVSIDELIGYRKSEREEKLNRIHKELNRLSEVGTTDERIRFARESLIHFPGDEEIKSHLATCLCYRWAENSDEAARDEAEVLLRTLMENSRDSDIRHGAVCFLIAIYKDCGNPEKAFETAELLAPMKYCREFAMDQGIGDGKTEWYIQDEIAKLTDYLGYAMRTLVLSEDLPNDPSTWDKKIEMLKTSNEIYRIVYGENLMFYHERLACNWWLISTYLIAQGKTEETLDALEQMCAHTLAYDRSFREDHGKNYTSVFTDKLIYPDPGKDFHELTEHNQSWYMLDRLQADRYGDIRDNKRFVDIVNALEEKAR
ncbi:MAG: helix-turn-helix transcriptional regulator [Clostridia bacterium]|nr:helix-turn-helix transcriptional regulator [Clostridia bacterium]